MRRAEIWWADLPEPAGARPVLLLSRDESYTVRAQVTVAPITSRIRGIRSEVRLGTAEGLPRECVANLDSIQTIRKAGLRDRIGALDAAKTSDLDAAIRFALAIGD